MDARELRTWIETLERFDRASCSPGEDEAAELIGGALRDRGATVSIERPRVHGTYWWPFTLSSAAGVLAALSARAGRGRLAVGLGTLGAAAAADDLTVGRRWLRRLLPKRTTANVLGWTGDERGSHTLVIVAHHDAAHSGIFFNPKIVEVLSRRAHWAPAPSKKVPPIQLPIVVFPALAGCSGLPGLRRLAGFAFIGCVGIIGAMANVARSATVPGANDNLTGVAVLLAMAERLRDAPIPGLRVLLLSTGAEEALMEGMHSFSARHLPLMDPDRTHVLCVDSVGSRTLVLPEAQGMLRVRRHDEALKELVADCARQAGISLVRGVTMRLGTDGYLPLRYGFRTALLMSVNPWGVASNYHWPTDTADRVDFDAVQAAVELCDRVARRICELTG